MDWKHRFPGYGYVHKVHIITQGNCKDEYLFCKTMYSNGFIYVVVAYSKHRFIIKI